MTKISYLQKICYLLICYDQCINREISIDRRMLWRQESQESVNIPIATLPSLRGFALILSYDLRYREW